MIILPELISENFLIYVWMLFPHLKAHGKYIFLTMKTTPSLNHVFFFFNFFFLIAVGFVIHWNESAMGLHVFPIPLGLPSAPGLSACLMHPTWAGDLFHPRQYTFRCYSFETSHPRLLPQSPKDCSIHLSLFFCFAYRVIINNFLNSIYMC